MCVLCCYFTASNIINSRIINVFAYANFSSTHSHFINSFYFTQYGNGAAAVKRYCLPRSSVCCNISNVGNVFCRSINISITYNTLHIFHKILCRRHNIQRTCINNAGFAYCHTVFAQEEQIAADFIIFNCVYSTVNINTAVNKVNKVSCISSASTLSIKVHISNIVSIQLKILKNIHSRIADNFICPNIGNIAIHFNTAVIINFIYTLCKAHHWLHNKPCRRYGRNNFLA